MPFDLKNSHSNSTRLSPEKMAEHEQRQENFDHADFEERDKKNDENSILHQWHAPEFEIYEKSSRWYIIAGIFITAMVIYALYTNGAIMAITFILIGIVGYIHLQKDPRMITFSITNKGLIADKDMYAFENIHSFWIFYDPHHTKTISLHTKASMLPFVHIPIGDEDPVHLRAILIRDIPEIKQDPSLIDAIERFLHI